MTQHDTATGLEIAIIGLAGRFPGASDPAALWRNLRAGAESITRLSDEELERSAIEDPALRADPAYVRAAAVLDDADRFDAAFFGVPPREAELMDPQARILLECAWAALEDAGYDPARHRGGIGIYAGARSSTYVFNLFSNAAARGDLSAFDLGLGNDLSFLTTRVSHRLDLRGPSCTVQTACSSSLVAIHLACQAVLANECKMALAGGVAISAPQRTGYLYQPGGITSPDGHCRAFDARAQGTVFGSGVGLVVLKRLVDALADGDAIRAVIKGSAINNDGAHKASFTAPSASGQARVIRDALSIAGIDARSISYVEAHGTGTALGDPIEVAALTRAYRAHTADNGFCTIGSVKTNVGHLDAAAGVTGLIKTVLALEHEELPATLHFERASPEIDFEATPFLVNASLRPWPRGPAPRRAGVSAFGVGGTNAHAILEEAPPPAPPAPGRPWHVLVLSARTASALDASVRRLADHLDANPALALADVAFTLQVGRQAFAHRHTAACDTIAAAVQALRAACDAPESAAVALGQRQLALLCPAEVGLTRGDVDELADAEPTFAAELARIAGELSRLLGADIRDGWALSPTAPTRAAPRVVDAAQVTLQLALWHLWRSWGVQASAALGDGPGALAAACAAGVLTIDEVARVLARNPGEALGDLGIRPRAPALALASAQTGGWLGADELPRVAPWTNTGPAARLDDALAALAPPGSPRLLLELGAGALVHRHQLASGALGVAALAVTAAGRRRPAAAALQEALGQLWQAGLEIDWAAMQRQRPEPRRRVALPTYPFERRRFWIEPGDLRTPAARPAPPTPSSRSVEDDRRDRNAMPPPGAEIALGSEQLYRAPRTEVERTLAAIWSELLGVDQIGVHDDFFHLGGHSLLALQVAARARRAGLDLTERHVLENATISALATALAAIPVARGTAPAPGSPAGDEDLPLTPHQRWFTETFDVEYQAWAMTVVWQAPAGQALELPWLRAAATAVTARHDALRLRLYRTEQGWGQRIVPQTDVPVEEHDLGAVAPDEQRRAILEIASRLQHTLSIVRGPVLALALCRMGSDPDRLLISIHHSAYDAYSLGPLTEDFMAAYAQLSAGQVPALLPVPTPYRQYLLAVANHAQSPAMEQDRAFWLDPARLCPTPALPVDLPGGLHTDRNSRRHTVVLTTALLEDARAWLTAHPTVSLHDLLLFGLVRSHARWSGAPALRLDLEHNGRTGMLPGVDLLRTIGPTTLKVPILFQVGPDEPAEQALGRVQHTLRQTMSHALGFGLLRYGPDPAARAALSAISSPQLFFNNRGLTLGRISTAQAAFEPLVLPRVDGGENLVSYELMVECDNTPDGPTVTWVYSSALYRPQTIAALADGAIEEIRKLLQSA